MSHPYLLPSRFILKRFKPNLEYSHPELASFKDEAVLIQTRRIGNDLSVYETILTEDPKTALGVGVVEPQFADPWFHGRKVCFTLQHGNSMRDCVFVFNKLVVNTASGQIPVLRQSDPCELYGNPFIFLYKDMYSRYRFPCIENSVIEPPPSASGGGGGLPIAYPIRPRSSNGKIPQHILNTYIQTLIDKQDNCPIEMTPLDKRTVRITPCGHALSANAAECWITYKHSCPVCREECSMEELQQWS